MKSIMLTNGEIMTCRIMGNMRTMSNRMFNVNDTQVGKQEAWETDEWGILGEYAFCKMNNIFFDFSITPRSGSYDCLYKGFRVDIKTTKIPTGQLISRTKKNPDVDIFVLAILDGNEVKFPGFCTADEFYRDENLKKLGDAKEETYVVPQSALRKWKE